LGADFGPVMEHLPSFLVAGGVGIGVSLTLFYVSLRHIDAYRTSAIFGMQAVFGAAGAFFFLGERVSVVQAGGAALMVGAVLAMALLHRPARPPEAPPQGAPPDSFDTDDAAPRPGVGGN